MATPTKDNMDAKASTAKTDAESTPAPSDIVNQAADDAATSSDQESSGDDEGSPEDESADKDEVITSSNDENWVESHNGASEPSRPEGTTEAPPLPSEALPPLPAELPPTAPTEDDGWAPVWEETVQAFYFYNRFTGATQWDNPRVPETSQPASAPGVARPVPGLPTEASPPTSVSRPAGGYDPAVHGDYDPTAWYAQPAVPENEPPNTLTDPSAAYAATGAFNRFTGRWQAADLNPENFNDENKSNRQMNAFFDVDAAANSHDGRSLKAERSGKKLSKAELKRVKDKKIAKKKEKQRAWLLD